MNNHLVLLQPAFVLHRRPYRETSYLVELFTHDYGRVSVIIKGVRKPKSALNGLLQAFTALLVSWSGKSELKNLTHVEAIGQVYTLKGDRLFTGFYLNELIMGLLDKWDAYPNLYCTYEKTIAALAGNDKEEKNLRVFEKRLLEELGYGLFPKANLFLNSIVEDAYYRFQPGEGLMLAAKDEAAHLFLGKNLIHIANEDWDKEHCLKDAKRLARLVLASLLGDKILHSRRLFMKFGEEK